MTLAFQRDLSDELAELVGTGNEDFINNLQRLLQQASAATNNRE